VGSTLEGKIGPFLYDHLASKERFARDMLLERGLSPGQVEALPQGEAFGRLVEVLQQPPEVVTRLLYESHSVGEMWFLMAGVGLVTSCLILVYSAWLQRRLAARHGRP
jgi:hypothetical protein